MPGVGAEFRLELGASCMGCGRPRELPDHVSAERMLAEADGAAVHVDARAPCPQCKARRVRVTWTVRIL